MAKTTKCTLRRGRERRKALSKSKKILAGLAKKLDAKKKAAKAKYGKSNV